MYHDERILLPLGVSYLLAFIPLQNRMQVWTWSEPVEACRIRVSPTDLPLCSSSFFGGLRLARPE